MTPADFRAALDVLKLSQLAAAPVLGSDPRTVRRWALGERPIPGPVVQLLAALIMLQGLQLGQVEDAGLT